MNITAFTLLALAPTIALSPSLWGLVFQDCTCEPVIVTETGDGADVTTTLAEVSTAHDYTATATLKNLGELEGLCNLGPGSGCTSPSTCEFNLAMKVDVTTGTVGDPLPYDFRVGGHVTLLNSTGGGYPFTGTSETKNYDGLDCESSQTLTVKVRDSGGNTSLRVISSFSASIAPLLAARKAQAKS